MLNNCAAAVLLVLDTFAKGREVIVARNQLVEIGGGFRIPDVLERSGAYLREVGATNKVYVKDFERALTPRPRCCCASIHRTTRSKDSPTTYPQANSPHSARGWAYRWSRISAAAPWSIWRSTVCRTNARLRKR